MKLVDVPLQRDKKFKWVGLGKKKGPVPCRTCGRTLKGLVLYRLHDKTYHCGPFTNMFSCGYRVQEELL